MKFHVVVNPVGASGRTLKKFQKILPVMEESGNEIEVHYSTKEVGLDALCNQLTKDLSSDEIINLIIVGGDGSLNVALNGMEHIPQIRLGYIPAGSGNDLAKGLGLGKDLSAIAKKIMEGNVCRKMDVGKIVYHEISDELVSKERIGRVDENGNIYRLFHDSTGFGFDAAICQAADASKGKNVLNKLRLGKLIYLACAMRLIFTTKRPMITVDNDGTEIIYPSNLLFVAMNNMYEGGGFKFCPEAINDDGILELCIATPKSNFAFFKIFPTGFAGHHVRFSEIHMDKGKSITVSCDDAQWVHTDGEVVCKAKGMDISVLPEQLSMLM